MREDGVPPLDLAAASSTVASLARRCAAEGVRWDHALARGVAIHEAERGGEPVAPDHAQAVAAALRVLATVGATLEDAVGHLLDGLTDPRLEPIEAHGRGIDVEVEPLLDLLLKGADAGLVMCWSDRLEVTPGVAAEPFGGDLGALLRERARSA